MSHFLITSVPACTALIPNSFVQYYNPFWKAPNTEMKAPQQGGGPTTKTWRPTTRTWSNITRTWRPNNKNVKYNWPKLSPRTKTASLRDENLIKTQRQTVKENDRRVWEEIQGRKQDFRGKKFRKKEKKNVTYPGCIGGIALWICGCILLLSGEGVPLIPSGGRFLGCLSSSDCPSSSHHSLSWPVQECQEKIWRWTHVSTSGLSLCM